MAGMTSDLSAVRGQLKVASQGAAGCVLREAGQKRQGNERQRNGRNPQVTAANRAYPRITAGNGGKAILKVGKNRRHSALITEYSPKTGKKARIFAIVRHCSLRAAPPWGSQGNVHWRERKIMSKIKIKSRAIDGEIEELNFSEYCCQLSVSQFVIFMAVVLLVELAGGCGTVAVN
jgi:hypothetical protein